MEKIDSNWWIWSAIYYGKDGNQTFLYGSAAPIATDFKYFPKEKIPVPDGGHIEVHQAIVTNNVFYSLTNALENNGIELGLVFDDIKEKFNVVTKRLILQASYGHGRNNVESYFTLPRIDKILGQDIYTTLPCILNILKETLGFPFDDQYATRLGCFEIHHLNPWSEDELPFKINLIKPNLGIKDISKPNIEFERNGIFSQSIHHAHIICRHEDEEVFNQLIKLNKGQRKSPLITTPDDFGELEAWLFDDAGKIVHHELNHYLLEISFGMGIQSQTVHIDDNLSKRGESLGHKIISTVTRTTTEHSAVSYGQSNGTKAHYALMKRLVAECFPKQEKDRWFKKSLENEIGVISHLKKIIDNGRVRKAVIVDPFFSEKSLIRLITRLSQTTLEIDIVTSWAKIDPDTSEGFSKDKDPIENLKKSLQNVKHVINPKLNIINLVWKDNQAFHDRYLVIYPIDGDPEAYLLSNSINKMSGNWPFCMSHLSPSVANEVILYTAALKKGMDITREGNPDITFAWPRDADK